MKELISSQDILRYNLINNEKQKFKTQVIDIINQILPTATILKTSYWPFFMSTDGRCLCLCDRYGIVCCHTFNGKNWINLSYVEESAFYLKLSDTCSVKPLVSTHLFLIHSMTSFFAVLRRHYYKFGRCERN